MPSIIKDDKFALISPKYMHYIVREQLEGISDTDLWKAVLLWAIGKVLRDMKPVPGADGEVCRFNHILPNLKLMKPCILNIVKAVEILTESQPTDDLSREESMKLIRKGHTFASNTEEQIMLCSMNNNTNSLQHKMFYVKEIFNCSLTTEPVLIKSSCIYITTYDKPYELYSLVCSGRYPSIEDESLENNYQTNDGQTKVYNSKCKVKVLILNTATSEFDLVSETVFNNSVISKEDFEIILYSEDKYVYLEPNSYYKVQLRFSSPHPLWKTMLVEDVPSTDNISVTAAFKKENIRSGTHVKYIMYRDV